MARRDLYHQIVRTALENEGWTITHDPLDLTMGLVELMADLGAERVLAAEKGQEKIAVEIKSFAGQSPVSEFHKALGQYDNYGISLSIKEPERQIYLAIPKDAWEDFFQRPFIQIVIHSKALRIIIFDIENQTIVEWIQA